MPALIREFLSGVVLIAFLVIAYGRGARRRYVWGMAALSVVAIFLLLRR